MNALHNRGLSHRIDRFANFVVVATKVCFTPAPTRASTAPASRNGTVSARFHSPPTPTRRAPGDFVVGEFAFHGEHEGVVLGRDAALRREHEIAKRG